MHIDKLIPIMKPACTLLSLLFSSTFHFEMALSALLPATISYTRHTCMDYAHHHPNTLRTSYPFPRWKERRYTTSRGIRVFRSERSVRHGTIILRRSGQFVSSPSALSALDPAPPGRCPGSVAGMGQEMAQTL